MEPTLAFINGNVVTMTGKRTQHAVAVANDRISAVGTSKEILALPGKLTHIIDLKGKTLLPGFIDPICFYWDLGFHLNPLICSTPPPMPS